MIFETNTFCDAELPLDAPVFVYLILRSNLIKIVKCNKSTENDFYTTRPVIHQELNVLHWDFYPHCQLEINVTVGSCSFFWTIVYVCCSCLQRLYESPVFKRCCVFKKELRSEIITTIKAMLAAHPFFLSVCHFLDIVALVSNHISHKQTSKFTNAHVHFVCLFICLSVCVCQWRPSYGWTKRDAS